MKSEQGGTERKFKCFVKGRGCFRILKGLH